MNNGKDGNYITNKRVALYWLLGTIYLAFACWELGRIQAIADFNYTLHELLYVPINAAIFLIPIEVILFFYYAIMARKQNKEKRNYSSRVKAILIIFSLVFITYIFYGQSNSRSTSGIFYIQDRVQEKNQYFIVLNNGEKIKCRRNEFSLVVEGEAYLVSYVWYNIPQKGSLELIEPINNK